MSQASTAPSPVPTPTGQASPARRKALGAIATVVVIGALAWAAYYLLVSSHYESTDNAYVAGSLVQITPQIGGTVQEVLADDTDYVKAGQPLVKLDPADARVALDQAEAALAQTVREVRTLFAGNVTLASQVRLRESELARVRAELARAQDDVNRRAPLVASGAVGKEEFNHASAQLASARSASAAAESALAAARDQLTSNQVLTDGTTPQDHPNVQRAAARVREAYLGLQRAVLTAPIEGYVARRNVQIGQRVQAGTPLLAVVPLKTVWVDANFKESQLQKLRIDQPVELHADVYGGSVVYHGKVVGLGAGTGSAFALLPAQNATGNWIKVVQRVPVRLALDAEEVAKHPLRIGLSMQARVDVADTSGRMLAISTHQPDGQAPSSAAADSTQDRDAQTRVQQIITANLGQPVSAAAPRLTPAAAPSGVAKAASAPSAMALAHAPSPVRPASITPVQAH